MPTSNANTLSADVVATQLVFATQPAPLSTTSGIILDFSTDPVVEARDNNGVVDTDFTDTITLSETGAGTAVYTNNAVAASAGVATFTGMTLTYTATADETFGLQADDTAGGAEGDLSTLPISSNITAYTFNSDGNLTASGTVSEPVALPSTATSTSTAVDLFDFALSDASTSDDLALEISQLVLNTSGTGPFNQLTFRLNGPDLSNVVGTYNASTNTLTFTGLSISIADGQSETYTVNAYYIDNTNLSENQTLIFSVDGDTDLTVSSTGTQMGSTNPVNNSTGSTIDITATQMVLATAPADINQVDPTDEVLSGSAFRTQPVIRAHDAAGNLDLDFADSIVASLQSGSGQLGGTSSASASGGIATFTDLSYNAASDGGIFVLSFDDQTSGDEGDLSAITSTALSADVVASRWVFTRQPDELFSGLIAGIQPEVQARNAQDVTDLDFAQSTTLSINAPGSIENNVASTNAGIASFTECKITGICQNCTLTASGGGLTSGTSASFNVDQALATITFSSVGSVVFNGQTHSLTSISDPPDLTIITTYDGSTDPPGDPGIYQVVATIDDTIYAGTATSTLVIAPPGAPIAGLQLSTQEGPAPLTVTFTNTSQGFGHTFLEAFDSDNQTFDDPESVQVTYDSPGIYEAVLTIRGQGGSNQIRKSITVHGPPDLDQAIAAPTAVPAGETHILDLSGIDQQAGTWSVELLGMGPIIRTEIIGDDITFFSNSNIHGTQVVNIIRTNTWGLSTSQQLTLSWTAPPIVPPRDEDPTSEQTTQDTSTSEPGNDTDPVTEGATSAADSSANSLADSLADPTTPTNSLLDALTDSAQTQLSGMLPGTDPNTSATDTLAPTSNDSSTTANLLDPTLPNTDPGNLAGDQTTTAPEPPVQTFFDATGEPVYGLFDDDLKVDFDDYFLFMDHYGAFNSQTDFDHRFDLDNDGKINLSDFFIFADNFGREAVPNP